MFREQLDDLKSKEAVAKGGPPLFCMSNDTREEFASVEFKKQLPLLVGMC